MNIRIKGALLGFALAIATPVFADDVAPAAPGAETAAHEDWVGDFDKAVEKAKAEKKDLLVDFTGSDWCGWCIKLHKEVFGEGAFLNAAKKDYILVSLDFPHDEAIKAKVPNPARNAELAKKYAVRGYPTVLLMNTDGEVYGRTGYQQGGAEKYVTHIQKLRTDGLPALNNAKAVIAELSGATGPAKAAAEQKAVDALAALDSDDATVGMLAPVVKPVFDGDPENKSGMRAKAAKALLKTGSADKSVVDAAAALDPKNELGLYEYVVLAKTSSLRKVEDAQAVFAEIETLFAAGGPKDPYAKKQLAIRAMSLAQNPKVMNDPEKAKEYAKRIRECGYAEGEEPLKEHIDKVLGDETK